MALQCYADCRAEQTSRLNNNGLILATNYLHHKLQRNMANFTCMKIFEKIQLNKPKTMLMDNVLDQIFHQIQSLWRYEFMNKISKPTFLQNKQVIYECTQRKCLVSNTCVYILYMASTKQKKKNQIIGYVKKLSELQRPSSQGRASWVYE